MIRKANENDLTSLARLLYQVQAVHAGGRPDIFRAGGRKYSDGELREILSDPARPVWVYEDDGAVLGYAFCVFQRTEPTGTLRERKTLYIDDLCVDEAARRRHIGTALFRYVTDRAREAGTDSVTLNVWALNEEAERFYRAMGLTPLKTTMEMPL